MPGSKLDKESKEALYINNNELDVIDGLIQLEYEYKFTCYELLDVYLFHWESMELIASIEFYC